MLLSKQFFGLTKKIKRRVYPIRKLKFNAVQDRKMAAKPFQWHSYRGLITHLLLGASHDPSYEVS